ncbi:MAG: hypothetical protein ACT4QA_11015 [Panacagrimonas sp.]
MNFLGVCTLAVVVASGVGPVPAALAQSDDLEALERRLEAEKRKQNEEPAAEPRKKKLQKENVPAPVPDEPANPVEEPASEPSLPADQAPAESPGAPAGAARSGVMRLPLRDAFKAPAAIEKLDPGIRFFFGRQSHPSPTRRLGSHTANKKTNFFNKSDKEGCEWVWLSAMLALQQRAKTEGGNAVIEIKSIYKGQPFVSSTEYECGTGTFVGGVALQGTVVKLP